MSSVEDRESIRETLARYCHSIDDGRWDEFESLWTGDASMEFAGRHVEGRGEILTFMQKAMPEHMRGRHLTTNSVIEIDHDRAYVTSDFLWVGPDGDGGTRQTTGRYRDVLTCDAERCWSFARRHIELDGGR